MKLHQSLLIAGLAFALTASPCLAKDDLPELKPIKEKFIGQPLLAATKKNLWGFANPEGKFMIKPEFEAVRDYVDGLACVKFGGKWGIINTTPVYIVTPIYDDIKPFDGDIAIVTKDGKYGIIDKTGAVRLPVVYDEIWHDPFFPSATMVRKGNLWDFIDAETGRLKYRMGYTEVVTNDGPYAKVKRDDKWGLLKKNFTYVTPIEFESLKYHAEGYYTMKQDGLYGAMNMNGDYLLPCKFTYAPRLSSELKAFFTSDKTYLASTSETYGWESNHNFNDPRMADLTITSAASLIELDLDNRTKLATYDNVPAYITHDGKYVWTANDNLKRMLNSPVSADYEVDSVYVVRNFLTRSEGETYYLEQDINIGYPVTARDFRFPLANIQKTIFKLCTGQDFTTSEQVRDYYKNGFHVDEEFKDYRWVAYTKAPASALFINCWATKVLGEIECIDNGIMYYYLVSDSYSGEGYCPWYGEWYPIDLKTGELMSVNDVISESQQKTVLHLISTPNGVKKYAYTEFREIDDATAEECAEMIKSNIEDNSSSFFPAFYIKNRVLYLFLTGYAIYGYGSCMLRIPLSDIR